MQQQSEMNILYPRCAGLDVHKDTVVACVRCVSAPVHHETRTFGTTTSELCQLRDWLSSHGCTDVAMEATGVYWLPVWHMLESNFGLVLANAQHIKNVPGRKSDVSDAAWIAKVMAFGLIRGSFVPPRHIAELRNLTRKRKQTVREVGQHANRIQKELEDANVKVGSVLSDVLGKSGRAMLKAIIAGETDPEVLAELALGLARKKHDALVEALRGQVTEHHRFALDFHLGIIEHLERSLSNLEQRVKILIEPIKEDTERLKTIPGVSDVVAEVIISEIGTDMSRFPTSSHLVSWAGLCPRSDESAGKRRSTRLRKSGTWLKTTMVTAAWAAVRTKNSYLRSLFLRLKARRGPKKAIIAVAASILKSVYHMIRHGENYVDLGSSYFDSLNTRKTVDRLIRRLKEFGVEVLARPGTSSTPSELPLVAAPLPPEQG